MKLFTLVALFAGASAIKLAHKPAHSFLKVNTKGDWPKPTDAEIAEAEAWAKDQLADGGTITKQEAAEQIQAFADSHDFEITSEMWAFLEKVFDMVDTDGSGDIDLEEALAAMEAHENNKPKKGKGKAFLGLKEGPNLTEAQVAEIEAWVKEELADGGTITKAEGEAAIKAFAKKHGFEITNDMWEELEAAFDAADCNGDGELEAKEVKRAMKGKACKKGKKGKKGQSCNPDGVQFPELNEAQHKEIHDWVVNELSTGDKTITKDEARAGVTAFAKKHGFEITEEMGNVMECEFDKADTNGDGAISEAELRKAME